MSDIEKTWWFSVPVSVLGFALAVFIMTQAGLPWPLELNAAQWIMFIFLSVGLQRSLSFLGWVLVLAISPSMATRGSGRA